MPPTIPLPLLSPEEFLWGLMLLSPVLAVVGTALLVLLLDLLRPDWASRRFLMWLSALGLLGALALVALLAPDGQQRPSAFGGFLVMDSFALFFHLVFLLAALLVILSASTFMDRQEQFEAEFYTVILFSTSGLMLLAAANELMTIYVSLELSSLSLAFLAAWNQRERVAAQGLKSTEAGIKFFLLSAMSSAVLLYGMALLYGLTGATTLADVSRVLTRDLPEVERPAALLSISMLVAGFGFKIAAAPFQLWTPDVYQGAPTPVTAFFSGASKAGGFAVILRIFNGALPDISLEWSALFGVLAFVTMTVGNLIAIVQTNIKRLMAYSSITHVGYMLIGLAAASTFGSGGVMYYLPAYAFTNLAAFIVIVVMARYAPDDEIAGYAGLANRSPALALGLTAALLSLAGIPPFVGFFAKLYLFLAAIERANPGLNFLVLWAVIMSAISLYYYGRVIHTMWMRDPVQTGPVRTGFSQAVALGASVVGVLVVGLGAAPFLSAAQVAASALGR
jgi:NADH-quinone oxidoreductase subunit N